MKFLHFPFRLIFVFSAVLGIAVSAPAESVNRIERISRDELQSLMQEKSCRCLVVAVASWCSPCRKELPALNRLFEKYRSQGISVVAVSIDAGGPEAMQPIVDKLKLDFPVYWAGEDALKDYKIVAVPTLFMIKNGETVERVVGQRSEKFLEKKIRKLLE